MTSTYSPNLKLTLMGTGDQSGTWGDTTNTNLGTLVEEAVAGYTTQALTGASATTTLTIPDGATSVGRNYVIEFTGTPTVTHTVVVPTVDKPYLLFNNTSISVLVKTTAGTGVTIAAGKKAIVYTDSTNVVEVANAPATEAGTQTLTNKTLASPTITTSATVPLVIGGTAVSSALTLQSTSGVGTTDSIAFKVGNNGATTAMTANTSGNIEFRAGTAALPAITTTGDTNTGIFFPAADTIAFTEGGAEAMRIDSSGNALIGTTNTPSNKDTVTPKMVVSGSGVAGAMQVVRHTSVGVGGGILELSSTRGTDVNSYTILQSGDGIGSVVFGGADGNEFVTAASIVAQVDGTPGDNDMPGRLIFNTTADGASSATERMRIDSSGNLLVGITTSDARLNVKGSGTASGTFTTKMANSAGTIGLQIRDDGFVGSPMIYAQTNANGANVTITSDGYIYRSTSSLKYKRDVEDATHGLAEVMQLRPVTYKGKSKSDSEKILGGLIAEEVHAAGLTEFVQYAEDGSPDALAYGNMVSLCIKAIQEQQAMITALTTRINALEVTP